MLLVSPNCGDIATPNIETKTFPDGDRYVRIPSLNSCTGEVTILHRLYPNQNEAIIEALLIISALKEKGATVTLIAPYLPYARQDKAFLEGELKSAQLICKLLANAGCTKLITFDCHFLKKEGTHECNGLVIENRSFGRNLIEHVKKISGKTPIVISPDEGASYLTGVQGKSMKKVRGDYSKDSSHAVREIATMERSFEVKGKDVIIIDDMIASGGTMIRAVKNVRAGGASKVFCTATHGFFLKNSLEELLKIADALVVSDTIPTPQAIPLLKNALVR